MNNLLFALCLVALTSIDAEEIRALDGTVYTDAKITAHTPIDVTIIHRDGVAHVPLVSLPVDIQKRFGYNPQKAAEYATAVKQQNQKRAAEAAAAETAAAALAAARAPALRQREAENEAAKAEISERLQQLDHDKELRARQDVVQEQRAAAEAAAQAKVKGRRDRADEAVNDQMYYLEGRAHRNDDTDLLFARAEKEAAEAETKGDSYLAELIRIRVDYLVRVQAAFRIRNYPLERALKESAMAAFKRCEATYPAQQEEGP